MDYLHYKVIRQLGEGGMGKVLLAEDTMLEKKVALKVLNPELSGSTEFIERFKQEAKIQSKLSHPNITMLYNLLFANETYFIVMEYAEGITLQDLIQKTGLIIESRAMRIFEQIYSALSYAHKSGIIHRDIKPSNIMISENDEVKIMDFGIAKLYGKRNFTRTNMKMGSLYYMSPEQINTPKDVDYRSDLFSLGIVLFEMLTGRLPYNVDTDSDFEVMKEIVYTPIPNPTDLYPHISDKTVELIISLTSKNRESRKISFADNEYFISTSDIKANSNSAGDSKEKKTRIIESRSNSFDNQKEQNKKLQKKKINPKKLLFTAGIILFTLLIITYLKIETDAKRKKVTDIDGNVYNTVTIGTQEWMAENLNVEHYRNGDIIPQVQDYGEWTNLTTGAWCYYENKSVNGKTYGKLYNWYAINDPRGLAPKSWHIPSDAEWTKLTDYLGGEKECGGKLKATSLWESPNTGATNESGFTAIPGGLRDNNGYFDMIGESVYFWTASENFTKNARHRVIGYENSSVFSFTPYKTYGYSVRCVKD